MHKVRVRVDSDLCIGAANCAAAAPEYFQLNANAISTVIEPGSAEGRSERVILVEEGQKMAILDAADSCPTRAITVEDVG
jgi:ferredoxin